MVGTEDQWGVVQEAFRERFEKVEGVQSTPCRSNTIWLLLSHVLH